MSTYAIYLRYKHLHERARSSTLLLFALQRNISARKSPFSVNCTTKWTGFFPTASVITWLRGAKNMIYMQDNFFHILSGSRWQKSRPIICIVGNTRTKSSYVRRNCKGSEVIVSPITQLGSFRRYEMTFGRWPYSALQVIAVVHYLLLSGSSVISFALRTTIQCLTDTDFGVASDLMLPPTDTISH